MILYVAIAALSALVAGPSLAHFQAVPPMAGLVIYGIAGITGLIVVAWGLIGFFRGKPVRYLVAAMLGLPTTAALAIPIVLGSSVPRISDVSTDPKNPPAFSAGHSYPETNKSVVAESYPDIRPVVLKKDRSTVFMSALDYAKRQGDWNASSVDYRNTTFEAVATSRLFRFREDFVVRVRAHPSGEGSILDMRSRSRQGGADYGSNARRIRRLLNNYR